MRSFVLPVLGLPVRFDTATPALGDAVDAAFGTWRELERYPELLSDPPGETPRIQLRMAAADRARAPGPLVIRPRPGGWIRLNEPGRMAGGARLDRMRARLRVTPEALDHPRSIHHALDTLTLFLLTRLDRQPVHAAAIATGRRGLVLAGPSGIGKSTLALAALRAGLRVLTDDAVYVQLQPRLRVWGMGRALHVPIGTAQRFPDLAGRSAVTRPGRKRKVPVELEPADQALGAPPVLERIGLCVLERGGSGPIVQPVPAEEAVRTLLSRLDPGFDAFRETVPQRLRALAAGGAWRLRVSEQPETALPAVVDLLSRIGR